MVTEAGDQDAILFRHRQQVFPAAGADLLPVNFNGRHIAHNLYQVVNFRAPDLSRISFSGDPDNNRTYKNCRKIKRKFKMQPYL